MVPFMVPIELETEIKKYSKVSNTLPFVELHDLRAGLYLKSIVEYYQQCRSVTAMLPVRFFFPA